MDSFVIRLVSNKIRSQGCCQVSSPYFGVQESVTDVYPVVPVKFFSVHWAQDTVISIWLRILADMQDWTLLKAYRVVIGFHFGS